MSETNESHSVDLLEILQGYSMLEYLNTNYYFKHFNILEVLSLDFEEKKEIKKSVKTGIKTSEELVKSAINIGSWSEKKEDKIKSTIWMIKKSEAALSKIEDTNQRKIFNNQIESQRNELKEIQNEKSKITNYSAEHLAQIKKIKKMVKSSIFLNKNFSEQLKEEHTIPLTAILFAKFNHLNSRETCLRASYNGGFFDFYVAQAGNPLSIFGVTYDKLTCFQKNLIVYSNSLLNKIKNVSIPPEIADDPVKVYEYEEKPQSESKTSHGVDDLRTKMAMRGGELKAEDFLS
tara:strand:+ start:13170 stop:14039 length:870 start_codon:yes stop_codon:yes gene_type:complete